MKLYVVVNGFICSIKIVAAGYVCFSSCDREGTQIEQLFRIMVSVKRDKICNLALQRCSAVLMLLYLETQVL